MIGLIQLGKSFGARTLFEGVSLNLVPGARYGLVGANGSGKTTLLKIIAGDEPSDGKVTFGQNLRIGVLRQDRFLDDAQSILDVAKVGDEVVTAALAEQARLLAAGEVNSERLLELEDRIAAHDGYTLEARASAIVEGLGIPVPQHRNALGTLSGGFKLRVLLAQVLIGGPDVLLLDEPTNHLDILSIRWLETFLEKYTGLAIVISHDQRFLDNVATHVLDVDYGTVSLYTGNYAAFAVQKRETRERKEAEIARAEAIIAEKRAFVERFGAKATKARQAQSRLKQIERIEVEELEQSSRRAPLFRFEEERPSGRDVLTLEGISKAYGEKRVLREVSLQVRRQERVAIIGPNGLGKSTLLKIATGNLAADAGRAAWGYEARVGYFAQDHRDVLERPDATPLDVIEQCIPMDPPNIVRGHLGRLLFSGDDVNKPVKSLSGGEAARLVFCRLSVQRPNVLVLDEPTNHLDLESIDALVEALKAFPGTLLFVSHDRAFVSALATRVLEVTERGFQDFPGTYQEYLERCGDDHLDTSAVVLRAKEQRQKLERGVPERSGAWEEKKRKSNRSKQLPGLRDAALKAVEQAEARKAAITAMWCEPGFFERTPADEVAALQAEERELGPRIDTLLAEWESLEAELEATKSTAG
ncbi:MAG: ATP-binding cassette domain-containing protein [Polyangiaceae bacterium]